MNDIKRAQKAFRSGSPRRFLAVVNEIVTKREAARTEALAGFEAGANTGGLDHSVRQIRHRANFDFYV